MHTVFLVFKSGDRVWVTTEELERAFIQEFFPEAMGENGVDYEKLEEMGIDRESFLENGVVIK